MLVNVDDTCRQPGGRRAVPTPWRSFVRAFGLARFSERWPRLFFDFHLHKQPLPEKAIEVEAISGACMMVSRVAMQDVGEWDEGYFLHCEDLDWCMRFRQNGWNILFVPSAQITHALGVCGRSRPVFVQWHKHKGMMRFYRKFFRHQYPSVMMGLVAVGVWLRFGLVAGYYTAKRLDVHWDWGVADANADTLGRVAILGASSLVGAYLLPMLTKVGCRVTAFSRSAVGQPPCDGIAWQPLPLVESSLALSPADGQMEVTPNWICIAPIWVLPDYFSLL